MSAFVNGVIAEAEAESGGPADSSARSGAGDFGAGGTGSDELPQASPAWPTADPAAGDADLVPQGPQQGHEAFEAHAPGPISISDAPPLVPLPDPASAAADSEDVETFAARRKRLQAKRKKSRVSSRWLAAILVLLAFNVALVTAREDVVRFLPQTASLFASIGLPVNLRHLKFEHVRVSRETQDGVTILVVEGAIVSTSSRPVDVPRLRFALRNAGGQEIYTWTIVPDRSILEPGMRLPFSGRVASPPTAAHDVVVRFFNARDAKADAN